MLYLKKDICLPEEQVSLFLSLLEDWSEVNASVLMMIHYTYHRDDEDFDGGLKLIDLLYNKLSKYFDIEWDVENMKNVIRNSEYPGYDYLDILNNLLTPEMIVVFGI